MGLANLAAGTSGYVYKYDGNGAQYYTDPLTGKIVYTGRYDTSKRATTTPKSTDPWDALANDPYYGAIMEGMGLKDRAKIEPYSNQNFQTTGDYKPTAPVTTANKDQGASDVWDQLYNPMPRDSSYANQGDKNAPVYDQSGYYTTTKDKNDAVVRYLEEIYGGDGAGGVAPGGSGDSGGTGGTGDTSNNRFRNDEVVTLKDATDVIATGSGGVSGYDNVGVPINAPAMPTGDALASTYGITQDRGTIEQILTDAVNARYGQLTQELMNNEDKTYDEMGILSRTIADSIDQNKMNAIQSGFSKGAADAMNLSAILGLTQQSTDLVTGMSDARADLSTKKTADLQLAKSDALTTSNDIGKAIAQIASEIYGNDVVRYGSELNYNASLESVLGGLLAQQYATDGQVTAAGISANGQRDAASIAAAASGGGYSSNDMSNVYNDMTDFGQRVAFFLSLGLSPEEAEALASRGGLSKNDNFNGDELTPEARAFIEDFFGGSVDW